MNLWHPYVNQHLISFPDSGSDHDCILITPASNCRHVKGTHNGGTDKMIDEYAAYKVMLHYLLLLFD